MPGAPVGQWALKLEHMGAGLDWSVSYFDGYDLQPDLGIDRLSPSGLDLLFPHHELFETDASHHPRHLDRVRENIQLDLLRDARTTRELGCVELMVE